jgi:hypothetical protein
MKEIVIGTNIEPIFNSIALWKWGDAAQNSVFYILKERLSDTRIYIYKESDAGEKIKAWLSCEENRNNESVQRKALELILPHLSIDDFLEIINNERKTSHAKGYAKAQYDMRKVLGLV